MNTLSSLPKSRIFIPLFVFILALGSLSSILTLCTTITEDYTFSSTHYNTTTPATLSPKIVGSGVSSGITIKFYQKIHLHTPFIPPLGINNLNIKISNRDINIDTAFAYNSVVSSIYSFPTGNKTINKSITFYNLPYHYFNSSIFDKKCTLADKKSRTLTSSILFTDLTHSFPSGTQCPNISVLTSSLFSITFINHTSCFQSAILICKSAHSGAINYYATVEPLIDQRVVSTSIKINHYQKI